LSNSATEPRKQNPGEYKPAGVSDHNVIRGDTMSTPTIASPRDLLIYFEQDPPKIIGEPRNYAVFADDISRVSTRAVNTRNRIDRVDAEGFPLPLHEGFSLTVADYDLGSDTFECEGFDFDSFINEL
jgi:hypothetical protein